MSWIGWTTLLAVWSLLGLGVAYLFGRFTHGAEVWGDAGQLKPPVVSYFRRVKRAKTQLHASGQAKQPKVAGARRAH